MGYPYFFIEEINDCKITLPEETSKHIINVLRMKTSEEILLTNGKGKKAKAIIVDDNRKKCVVEIVLVDEEEETKKKVTIAISLIKNTSRFEWFLEKATEIGVSEIIPLICERTEKEKFRHDRLQQILVSAMLQSQQTWLPVLHPPTNFKTVIAQSNFPQKFIAHCLPHEIQQLSFVIYQVSPTGSYRGQAPSAQGYGGQAHPSQGNNGQASIILIGPEGDFTNKEIELALENNFLPVALGETRLRTETAGIVAATLLSNYSLTANSPLQLP